MKIDRRIVDTIAHNARLHLSDDECTKLIPQLQEILDIFDTLQDIDTKDIDVSLHPVLLAHELRKDRPEDCLSQEEALSNATHKKDGFFRGPKVL